MKVGILGAGGLGAFLATRLWEAGCDVTLLARGERLRTIESRGIELLRRTERIQARPQCVAFGTQQAFDVLLVCLKHRHLTASTVETILSSIDAPYLVFCMNGVFWWYPFLLLEAGRFSRPWPFQVPWANADFAGRSVSGLVAHTATESPEPGTLLVHAATSRFLYDGRVLPPRFRELAHGVKDLSLIASDSIYSEMWTKLVLNAAIGLVALRRRLNNSEIAASPTAFREAVSIGSDVLAIALAAEPDLVPFDVESYLTANMTSPHKTSLLLDLERGLRPDIEAVATAPLAIGDCLGVRAPDLALLEAQARQVVDAAA
jgi:2-dehydropantoate 2-reductase